MTKEIVVNNYKEFLDEMEKGKRRIGVTEEFYEWLRTELGDNANGAKVNPRSYVFYGVQVYKVKEK